MKNEKNLKTIELLKCEELKISEKSSLDGGYPFWEEVGSLLHEMFCPTHNAAIRDGGPMNMNYILH